MNNKGFAVSMILYSIMALLVFVMLLILGVNAATARNNNNIADSIKEDLSIIDKYCKDQVGKVIATFDYTGEVVEYQMPCDGVYKLEVWGAEGGSVSVNNKVASQGGYGGYSYGNVILTKNQNLYIGVGGSPGYSRIITSSSTLYTVDTSAGYGGYNGGGLGSTYYNKVKYDSDDERYEAYDDNGGGGGGATHIAINNNRGELKNYESYQSEVLIVAGGGGGCGEPNVGNKYPGGSGGGIEGVGPKYLSYDEEDAKVYTYSGPTGGTQTTGGDGYGENDGGFGYGGSTGSWYAGGGGGGGWYGGGAGRMDSTNGGSGGSGYIGNSLLSAKGMYTWQRTVTEENKTITLCTSSTEEDTYTVCTEEHSSTPTTNTPKEGHGYAQITLVSLE